MDTPAEVMTPKEPLALVALRHILAALGYRLILLTTARTIAMRIEAAGPDRAVVFNLSVSVPPAFWELHGPILARGLVRWLPHVAGGLDEWATGAGLPQDEHAPVWSHPRSMGLRRIIARTEGDGPLDVTVNPPVFETFRDLVSLLASQTDRPALETSVLRYREKERQGSSLARAAALDLSASAFLAAVRLLAPPPAPPPPSAPDEVAAHAAAAPAVH